MTYVFQLVPPLLNLGSQGTLHTYKQAQPDHATYTTLVLMLFSLLYDQCNEILLMQELWTLITYKEC